MSARHLHWWAGLRRVGSIGRRAAVVIVTVLAVGATAPTVGATGLVHRAFSDLRSVVVSDEERALATLEESLALAAEGRLEDALAKAQEALALAKLEFGDKHRTVALISIQAALLERSLGRDLAARGQYCRARPLYEQAHATLRAQLRAEHELMAAEARDLRIALLELTAATARDLGIALLELAHPAQALEYFEEAMAAQRARSGERSIAFARASLDLASAEIALERSDDARARAADATAVLEQGGAGATDLATAKILEARAAIKQAALTEAETLLKEAQQRLRSAGEQDHPLIGHASYFLGFVNILRGRFIEAQPRYQDALEAYTRLVGPHHPAVARARHQLAMVYQQIGWHDEAQKQYQAAIDIFKRVREAGEMRDCGPDPAEAATLAERAVLHADLGNFTDAEGDARAALAIFQQADGDWRLREGFALSALGHTLRKQNRLLEAEAALGRAIELIETVRGPEASDLPPGLNELALIALEQGRPVEAEMQARRAVAIRSKDAALTPWGFARAQTTLALTIAAQEGRQYEALREIRKATEVMRSRLDLQGRQRELALGESLRERDVFERHLEVAYAVYEAGDEALIGEIVEVLQYPHLTTTAMALRGVSARFARAKGLLPQLVRARQRAIEEWTARDRIYLELLSSSAADPQDVAKLRSKLSDDDDRIRELDGELEERFPQFADLTRPRPVPGGVLQNALRPSEAMLIQVTADEATYLALVTPAEVSLARTDLGSGDLDEHVKLLRTAVEVTRDKKLDSLRGFDVARAHRLYKMIFAPFAQQLQGLSTLFFVPDGAMQNITPAVLLMEPAPEDTAYSYFDPSRPELFEPLRELRFLGLEVPIAVLPSPGSLQSLRQLEALPEAERPFIGFAPLEWGDIEAPSDTTDRGPAAGSLSKDGISLDVVAFARRLPPLPEAAEELREIGELLGADSSSVVLGPAATERAVRSLPPRAAEVLVFATHAVIKGEFGGIVEPALIMHLDHSERADDEEGVLFASEIAQLRLQADWVILSACNTAAAAEREGAEGLSGLAKAFFYAGTRSLMVSHWWVNSEATVQLTTGAVRALRKEPELSRAQAMRRSMSEVAKNPKNPAWSHPYFWAPFTVVGAAN